MAGGSLAERRDGHQRAQATRLQVAVERERLPVTDESRKWPFLWPTPCYRGEDLNPVGSTLRLWLSILMLAAGCGFTVADKGSDINISGIALTYMDWVAPAQNDWLRDSYECERDAREAFPSLFRLPGRRQAFAERCLMARGYVKR